MSMEGMEFEINFTDRTLLEGNGEFEEVDTLMKKPQEIIGGMLSPVPSDKWTIKSNVTILHGLGFGQVTCDFYSDDKIVITEFAPSAKDLYCVDIRCLTAWAMQYGWQRPEPLPHIVKAWQEFWVLQWETHIIDSEYLDNKLGERGPNLFVDDADEEDVGDADDLPPEEDIDMDDDLEKYRGS